MLVASGEFCEVCIEHSSQVDALYKNNIVFVVIVVVTVVFSERDFVNMTSL